MLPENSIFPAGETEEEGFEPPVPCGTTVFKTVAINHSATPPSHLFIICYAKNTYLNSGCIQMEAITANTIEL
jgi:hypothetical protein